MHEDGKQFVDKHHNYLYIKNKDPFVDFLKQFDCENREYSGCTRDLHATCNTKPTNHS